jgi:phospholipid/cholesterol/gamma-HCH transport system ATP-binding protein
MIEIQDLYKSYGSQAILKGLTATIPTGKTLVILGRSGVGKSVLLKHIMGLTRPDMGKIIIDNHDLFSLSTKQLYEIRQKMGMLFQGAALFDSMNVEENVGFYLTEHNDPKTQKPYPQDYIKKRVEEALEMVGLNGTQKKNPSELSGGMRKRAGLARLIAYRPQIILYDEPTTGLDPITSMQINQLICKTQKELNATSIVVTHDLTSALCVGDLLALHDGGRLSYIMEPQEFLKQEHPIIEFFRKTLDQDPRKLKEVLWNEGTS